MNLDLNNFNIVQKLMSWHYHSYIFVCIIYMQPFEIDRVGMQYSKSLEDNKPKTLLQCKDCRERERKGSRDGGREIQFLAHNKIMDAFPP